MHASWSPRPFAEAWCAALFGALVAGAGQACAAGHDLKSGNPYPEGAEQKAPDEAAQTERIERYLGAMGTQLVLEVEGPSRIVALQASEAAAQAVEAVEERLSTWRTNSELSQLNQSPLGEPFLLSPELAQDLRFCREMVRLTQGAFDPAIAPLVRACLLYTSPSPRDS